MSNEEVCCPRFDPTGWDNKEIEWKDKKFIKGKVKTFLFMPIGFGKVMTKLQDQVQSAGADVPGYLCLSEHTSRSNMDLYLATDKEIPGADNTTLTGKYFSKVYEGPFQDTGKWTKDFTGSVKEAGYDMGKLYMWYTTCPKCAKKYGKNYVVILASI
jgi:hypothetical protein